MRHWDLTRMETPGGSRSPIVLHSSDEARAVLIALEPGQELGDHQVKENAFVAVLDGRVRVEAGGEAVEGSPGSLFLFAPDERRSVASEGGARLLLFFAPWPGEGHFRGEERALA